MQKLVILGSKSMAGHVIEDYFSKKEMYSIESFDEKEIFDKNLVINKDILFKECDYLINCIRCLVQESEKVPHKAIIYNSYLPNFIGNYYKKKKTKIVNLSTDCVFLGDKGNYMEFDEPDGKSVYSRTKALGETKNEKDILIRTSYIGPNLKGYSEELFDWFLNQHGDVDGYVNSFWNGITTLELAKNIFTLFQLDFSGTYHLIGKSKISKYELLQLIKNIWNHKEVKLKKYNNHKIDRSLIDSNNMIPSKDYYKMFEELRSYMNTHHLKYSKYF